MDIETQIEIVARKYSKELKEKMHLRAGEMGEDDKSHYLIYQVLEVTDQEGDLIDLYQNRGRFLYKYAGSFLEEATILCFRSAFPDAIAKLRVENSMGSRPKTFEIDCLVGKDALEIKWRDATPDGDHITKEHTKVKVIQAAGFKPIRIMFYYPNRLQAIKIQDTLKTIYAGVQGEYYWGESAWEYVRSRTMVDLKSILKLIAQQNIQRLQTGNNANE